MVQKTVKTALKQKKRKCTDKLHAFEKIGVSDSKEESMDISSGNEGEIWKLSSGKLFGSKK